MIAAIAAFIMLAGVGMVSGTYYFDKVELPQNIAMKESTTIYYSDGVTPIAKIGEENRTMVTLDKVPIWVQHAIVATEDNSFYTNSGVDYRGVARAAWNNLTGGETQGASTISQQYARHWADLSGVTYARKLREAVIAMKLNEEYSKSQIMEMYLNIVYFGRQAYGIEAAAQAYFGKDVSQLTMAEGMILAGCIKDPEGNGKGSPYDPTVNKTSAMDRFNNYIKPNMLKLKFMTQDEYDKMTYPTTVVQLDANNNAKLRAQWGLDTPQGLIVHHVMDELSQVKNPDGSLKFADSSGSIKNGIRNGGLKIVTTINQAAENDAIGMAGGSAKGSPMVGQHANLQAALVSVEPGDGRVIAYYGGATGSGNDYAAFYNDPVLGNGEDSCCPGHPPGSSFKIYTLATALLNGYSITSYWNGDSPLEFPASGRTKGSPAGPVKNAGDGGGGPGNCLAGPQHCMLWEAAEKSLNTPFFAITEAVGASHVLDTAKAAGIRYMWATVNGQSQPVRENVQTAPSTSFVPKYFQTEIGFGQYPITVLDHANGTATIAARGWASGVHFVKEVDIDGKKRYSESVAPHRIPGFTDAMADDMDWVLQKIPVEYKITLANGRQSAGKTGTWQLGQSTSQTAHAWFTGFTGSDPSKNSPGLATSVWVGNKGQEEALKLASGQSIIGGKLPGPIWKAYMDKAFTDLKEPKIAFAGPKYTGDKEEGNATSPQPSLPAFPSNDPNNPGGNFPTQAPTTTGQGGGGGGGVVPRASRTKNR